MSIEPALRLRDEAGRLAALRRYEILDSEPEKEFSDLVSLVRTIFNTRYAAINLIDSERQWSKAVAGTNSVDCHRDDAFCNHTISSPDALSIQDTRLDQRFVNNLFVTGDTAIRSYLGVSLTSPDGYNIGAICVFDPEPRKFTEADVEVLRNFSKVVMSQFELRIAARQDSLTGSLTRRAFLDRMEQAMGSEEPVTLLLLDLDHFKAVNDTFGHPIGDEVLKSVAASAQASLRRSDSLGRLGGEEFAILLPGAQASGGMVFAERLRNEVAARDRPEVDGTPVTLSIGIGEYRKGETRDQWMARTDQALYAAKMSGRNRCVFAD